MISRNTDLPHDSAHTHVRGESEFIDDRPLMAGEVFVEVVYSPVARGRIVKMDSKLTLKVPGVCAVFTALDFENNFWGPIFKDQPLLAEKEVSFVGEALALVVGETPEAARAGRNAFRVKIKETPAILSIQQALEARSFFGEERKIERGEVEFSLKNAPHQIEGQLILEGADHFYLESQACVAYPKEDGQIEIHSSSQHPTEVQHVVAHSLGIPNRDVVCVVKRMGGGFGGKESQASPFAAYASLVAYRLRRPARLILTKDDDMVMTGKRNPFWTQYKVGFNAEGEIESLDIRLYSDGGAYADLSPSIMERAMLHCDNAYYIPNIRVRGRVCRTNFHPHTAFRGFGAPKGVATVERVVEEIAHYLKLDPLDVRKKNCYSSVPGQRDTTPYGQRVNNNCLPALFEKLEATSEYRKRRSQIESHNKNAGRDLRGLSITPVKFGISFTTRFLNQGNALVVIHRDGTLQVSTGATEMGQGVNARIAELVSSELGIERKMVRVLDTSTRVNANTSPTAASSGADLNGAAALQATQKLRARLSGLALHLLSTPRERWAQKTAGLGTEPEFDDSISGEIQNIRFEGAQVFSIKKPHIKIDFNDLIEEAYLNRISLSEYQFFKFEGLSFNKITGKGDAFLYFTQGAAVSEVSVNQVTGEVKVLRVDILMELGEPINRALDLGQVSGAFVQGMGWVTTEHLTYSGKGALLTHAPSTYKIPSVQDTPRIFKIDLFKNDQNRVNVRGSKAVGEPPLLLALSVWTAIQDALKSRPLYSKSYPRLDIPATQERVLRAIMPERFKYYENLK